MKKLPLSPWARFADLVEEEQIDVAEGLLQFVFDEWFEFGQIDPVADRDREQGIALHDCVYWRSRTGAGRFNWNDRTCQLQRSGRRGRSARQERLRGSGERRTSYFRAAHENYNESKRQRSGHQRPRIIAQEDG